MLEHGELVGDFRSTQDRDKWPLGIVQEPRQHGFLALEEQPGVGRQQLRHTHGRGVRAVSRAEGVVDEEIAEPGQVRGEISVVGLLARIEAEVLDHEDVARLQGRGGAFHLRTGDRGNRGNPLPEELAQPTRDRSHGIRRICFSLRSPEMRRQDDRRPSVQQVLNRRQRRSDAGVVGHFTVAQRHIEIDPHQRSLAVHVGLGDRSLWHGAVLRAAP
jgi:hypothetical protein